MTTNLVYNEENYLNKIILKLGPKNMVKYDIFRFISCIQNREKKKNQFAIFFWRDGPYLQE